MIVVHKPSGEIVILGTDQEKLLRTLIDIAIDEGEIYKSSRFRDAPSERNIEYEKKLEQVKQLKKTLA